MSKNNTTVAVTFESVRSSMQEHMSCVFNEYSEHVADPEQHVLNMMEFREGVLPVYVNMNLIEGAVRNEYWNKKLADAIHEWVKGEYTGPTQFGLGMSKEYWA